MSFDTGLLQHCGTLNRVFAAFFMNECAIKEGINFEDSKPQAPQIACLNEEGHYFVEGDSIHGLKHFFEGKVEIENIDIEKLISKGIYEFFDDDIKDKIIDLAIYFSNQVKSHKYCDFVFSSLPDYPPYIFDCILDPETNFRSRLIIGKNLANTVYSGIWNFSCLLVAKLREVQKHPTYGRSFSDVDFMTDEDRKKYNVRTVIWG